jgi:hypothetical protein
MTKEQIQNRITAAEDTIAYYNSTMKSRKTKDERNIVYTLIAKYEGKIEAYNEILNEMEGN